MKNLKIFENAEFGSVRMVEIENVPYFVGKDVADILGYKNGSRDINAHTDYEDRLKYQISTSGQNRETILINESGLYSLILSSKLPTAKIFKQWVTSEVLPSIRKNGMYATYEILNNPDLAIAILQQLKVEREEKTNLQQTMAVQNQQILEMTPKANYHDVVLNCKDLVAISTIAKDYGMSATALNKLLNELRIQYKQGAIWLLYQNYATNGYTSTKTHTYLGDDGAEHTKPHTYWTQKGRLFIYELLKFQNIVPLIERKVM